MNYMEGHGQHSRPSAGPSSSLAGVGGNSAAASTVSPSSPNSFSNSPHSDLAPGNDRQIHGMLIDGGANSPRNDINDRVSKTTSSKIRQKPSQSERRLQEDHRLPRYSPASDSRSLSQQMINKKRATELKDDYHNGGSNLVARAESINGGSDDEDGESRKKRQKQALSCGECKRRKIKCDRKIPCVSCIRRGTPEACSWSEARIEPLPQPFALVADVRRMAQRLSEVERFLQTLPPKLRVGAPKPVFDMEFGTDVKETVGISLKDGPRSFEELDPKEHTVYESKPTENGGGDLNGGFSGDVPAELDDPSVQATSDTEDAAVKLEQVAFTPYVPKNQPLAHRSTGRRTKEYTRAMTCIVVPLTIDANDPFLAVQLGYDINVPSHQIPRRVQDSLQALFDCLPGKQTSYMLVEKFFTELEWVHRAVHTQSFLAEHDYYWEMVETGRLYEVDVLWLSVYCMLLALSLDGLRCRRKSTIDSEIMANDREKCNSDKWFAVARRFMLLGDWTGKPAIRSIQAIILFVQWFQISSAGGQEGRYFIWIAGAIRLAQVLGLHQLGDNPEVMPPDDPALPPGKNSVKRHVAVRLFGILCFVDWWGSSSRFRAYMLHPAQFNTGRVANLSDIDLSPTEWKINPKPQSTLTTSSFEIAKFQMSRISRTVFDRLVTAEPSSFSYETVLELDRDFRQLFDHLPDIWVQEHAKQESSNPGLHWTRNIVTEAVHSRIVRLHRPFMTRGYNANSRFRYSCIECVKSAKIVIVSLSNVLNVSNNVWFIYNHALGAAIVLFADLFHAIDVDTPELEIETRKETLALAFEIFGNADQIISPALRTVVEKGSKILSGLLLSEEKRRVTRAARTLVGGGPPANIESFAQVLQRLTRELDIRPAPMPSSIQERGSYPPLGQTVFSQAKDFPISSEKRNVHQDFMMQPSDPGSSSDQLPSEFFSGIGLASGTGSFDYWSQPDMTGIATLGTGSGFTPPDLSFLTTGVDWNSIGVNTPSSMANSSNMMAANALLESMAGSF